MKKTQRKSVPVRETVWKCDLNYHKTWTTLNSIPALNMNSFQKLYHTFESSIWSDFETPERWLKILAIASFFDSLLVVWKSSQPLLVHGILLQELLCWYHLNNEQGIEQIFLLNYEFGQKAIWLIVDTYVYSYYFVLRYLTVSS